MPELYLLKPWLSHVDFVGGLTEEATMARADLLLDIVRAGAEGNQELFKRALEALVAEERSKQHNVLADQLASHLAVNGTSFRVQRGTTDQSADRSGFFEVRPRRNLADLVLPLGVRETCHDLIEEHHRAELLRAHGLEPRHRILLSGPPGNGKTSLAEALAFELGIPLLLVRYETIIGSYLGESASRLAQLFSQARTRRCVLFFDEFDAIGKERGDVHETGEIKRVVSSLLLQIDRLPSHVVTIAASNHSELLDSAAWRRFQLRLTLPNPTMEQRRAWLKSFVERTGVSFGTSMDLIARSLGSVSFSELELFALEVHRKYILALPSGDISSIIRGQLARWKLRTNPKSKKKRVSHGR